MHLRESVVVVWALWLGLDCWVHAEVVGGLSEGNAWDRVVDG
jgi:hypothetical protein